MVSKQENHKLNLKSQEMAKQSVAMPLLYLENSWQLLGYKEKKTIEGNTRFVGRGGRVPRHK